MVFFIENPEIAANLTQCKQQISNFSNIQNDMLTKLTSQSNTITILYIILAIIFGILLFYIIYRIYRSFNIYKLGFVRNNKIQWLYKWHIAETMLIKHSKNDKFTYRLDSSVVYGQTIMWYYHNPNPIQFDQTKPATKDLIYDTLIKSTVIEKFVTAEDFMNIIKILIIIGLVLTAIAILVSFITYRKEMICNLILDNRTILTNVIK